MVWSHRRGPRSEAWASPAPGTGHATASVLFSKRDTSESIHIGRHCAHHTAPPMRPQDDDEATTPSQTHNTNAVLWPPALVTCPCCLCQLLPQPIYRNLWQAASGILQRYAHNAYGRGSPQHERQYSADTSDEEVVVASKAVLRRWLLRALGLGKTRRRTRARILRARHLPPHAAQLLHRAGLQTRRPRCICMAARTGGLTRSQRGAAAPEHHQ